MAQMDRREWLKSLGMAGSLAFMGVPALGEGRDVLSSGKKTNNLQSNIVRLSSNENPFGPSEKVRNAIKEAFDDACRYPYDYNVELIQMLAEREGVTPEHIVVTVGSTEALRITGLTYGIGKKEIIAAKPTFLAMMTYASQWGAAINWVPLDNELKHNLDEMEKRVNKNTGLVFICNPNNPTSTLLDENQLNSFVDRVSDKTVVFSDEAYYDYIEEKDYPSMISWVKKGKDVIVSRTFSKVYGMAGLRIGYIIAKPEIANKLRANMAAYPSVPAIQGAKAALKDQEFYQYSIKKNKEARKIITSTLDELQLEYVPSNTNFVFFKSGRDISKLGEDMLALGVKIGRPFPPLTNWCRISTGTLEEVKAFREALLKLYA